LLAKALVNHNIPFEQHVSVFSTQKLISPSFFLSFASILKAFHPFSKLKVFTYHSFANPP
jgi:hypothetical protein